MNRTPQKDWTVMIYMAGDNDLDDTNDLQKFAHNSRTPFRLRIPTPLD